MKQISLYLLRQDIEDLDRLVEQKLYPNRAEAIRFAVKDLLEYHAGTEKVK